MNVDLLNDVLGLKDANARAAGVRVLTYWQDRVPGSLELLKKMAADDSARVRLIAIWLSRAPLDQGLGTDPKKRNRSQR